MSPGPTQSRGFQQHVVQLQDRCEGFSLDHRDVDWCSDAIRNNDDFEDPGRHVVEWERIVSVENWLTDLESHSYVIAMSPAERAGLLSDSEALLRRHFADRMVVPYQARL